MESNKPKRYAPSEAEIAAMWQEITVEAVDINDERVSAVVDAFRSISTNGGSEFACFQISRHPVLEWFVLRNRLKTSATRQVEKNFLDFFGNFLTLEAVRSRLSMFNIHSPLPSCFVVQSSDSYTLDGQIARSLAFGGAYKSFRDRGPLAKQLGMDFCEALFGNRFEDVLVYQANGDWSSSWFKPIKFWDVTWFGFDQATFQIWMLAFTDED